MIDISGVEILFLFFFPLLFCFLPPLLFFYRFLHRNDIVGNALDRLCHRILPEGAWRTEERSLHRRSCRIVNNSAVRFDCCVCWRKGYSAKNKQRNNIYGMLMCSIYIYIGDIYRRIKSMEIKRSVKELVRETENSIEIRSISLYPNDILFKYQKLRSIQFLAASESLTRDKQSSPRSVRSDPLLPTRTTHREMNGTTGGEKKRKKKKNEATRMRIFNVIR